MKTLLHGDDLIIASENHNERMFLQSFKGLPAVEYGIGYFKYKFIYKYSSETESLLINREKVK